MVFSFVFATASVWACGDDPAPADPCPKDDPTTPVDESECAYYAKAESGLEAITKRGCKTCHGDDMSGADIPLTGKPEYEKTTIGLPVKLYPPNLTNDPETGLGSWNDDAIAIAIRTGYDKDGLQLCPQMNHFSNMSDFEVYSIVKYLRTLSVNKKVHRSVCPPTKEDTGR